MFQEMMEELALVEREKERKSVEYTAAQQKEKTLKVIFNTYDWSFWHDEVMLAT